MSTDKNRREWGRKTTNEPELGVITRRHGKKKAADQIPVFIGVHNRSEGGMMIDLPNKLAKGEQLEISLCNTASKAWETHQAEVVWTKTAANQKEYLTGLKFLPPESADISSSDLPPSTAILDDLDFLLNTKMLKYIPQHAVWSLLNCLTQKHIRAGKKIMTQGESGKCLCIIQHGTCQVIINQDGKSHKVAQLKTGDVVGEMAVLTGEPRYAGVVAETDIKLWELSKKQFEEISTHHPDLRMFLTDLVTNRLESSPHTADRTIGKYQIKLKLGQGAWSIVYQGVHTILHMPVAIKMLKHQMAMDQDFHERFKKEAEIIARMNHNNIVHVYDTEERYQTLFIVMEYLDGESLENILARKGELTYAQIVNFLAQISSGLSYAHKKGIVHQDIKPANILIQPEEKLKILDFGLACAIGCESVDLEGTVFYMAPEQIEGDPVDARTDIYSLGITAYEMVVGKRPYPEDDLADLMDMHVEQDIPDPIETVPDIPEALRAFIIKACRRDPAERYQDMEEALADLQPLYNELVQHDQAADYEKKRMATMFFFYKEEQRGALNELLEEFSTRAEQAGIAIKAADFKNVG